MGCLGFHIFLCEFLSLSFLFFSAFFVFLVFLLSPEITLCMDKKIRLKKTKSDIVHGKKGDGPHYGEQF